MQINKLSYNPDIIALLTNLKQAIYYSWIYGRETQTLTLEKRLSTERRRVMSFRSIHRSSSVLKLCHFFKHFFKEILGMDLEDVYMDVPHIFLNV